MFPSKWEISRSNGRMGDHLSRMEVSRSKREGWNICLIDVACCIGPPMIQYNLGKICKTYPPRFPKNTFPEVFYTTLSKLASTHWHRLWHCYKFLCSIFSKRYRFHQMQCNSKISLQSQYISHIKGIVRSFHILKKKKKKWIETIK